MLSTSFPKLDTTAVKCAQNRVLCNYNTEPIRIAFQYFGWKPLMEKGTFSARYVDITYVVNHIRSSHDQIGPISRRWVPDTSFGKLDILPRSSIAYEINRGINMKRSLLYDCLHRYKLIRWLSPDGINISWKKPGSRFTSMIQIPWFQKVTPHPERNSKAVWKSVL